MYVRSKIAIRAWGLRKGRVYKVLQEDRQGDLIQIANDGKMVGDGWFGRELFTELTNVEKLVGGYVS